MSIQSRQAIRLIKFVAELKKNSYPNVKQFRDLLRRADLEENVDCVCSDLVRPKVGSILYCDLAFGTCEHSGVYVGNSQIVHLNGDGEIECVSPEEFIEGTSAISIYVSSRNGMSVGNGEIALRALSRIGGARDYNLLSDNCHQFTSGCISGDSENRDNFLSDLKDTAKKSPLLRANEWRVWERHSELLTNSIDEFPAVPSLEDFIARADGETEAWKAFDAYMTLVKKAMKFGRAMNRVMEKSSKAMAALLEDDIDGDGRDGDGRKVKLAGIKATQDVIEHYFDAYNKLADEADARHDALMESGEEERG